MAKRKAESARHKAHSAPVNREDLVPDMTVERSSGNVFADLQLPDAAELDTKLRLAWAINVEIEGRGLSQTAVAALLGINQPKVSALRNYKLDGFSVERLMTFLTAFGRDIEIRIRKPKGSGAGRILVEAA